MKPQFRILIIGFFFLSIPFVKSTILVPFRHLGELTQFADQVLYVEAVGGQFDINLDEKHEYFPVKVISTIKGNAQIDDFIKIRSYHTLINEMESKIWGDINLKEHVKYLVFLKQSNIIGDYQAIGLSYYVFEEKIIDGEPYLIPCDESRYIHLNERPDGFPAEPLTDYKRDDLLKYLKLYTINGNHWYGKMAIPDLKIEKKIEDIQLRTEPPSWCTFLFVSEPWSRWTGFPASPLPVKYQSTGDIDCPTSITKTQAAIPVLSSAYAGINLTDGSSFSGYTPNCMGGSAYQGNFISFCNSTLGGVRNVAIIYNDPCSEVPDLSSCSGTLAIGGSYTTGGTNMYQGKTWNTAGYGFVIVNNGVGACYCSSSFTIMLEHEITHTLGIGHISSGAGVANMNPSCCNTISSLDIACLEYSYSSSLPVELSAFYGELKGDQIDLNWSTVSEKENEKFILEYSNDGIKFNTIYNVAGAGNSFMSQNYNYRIKAQEGINYFRLSQKDFSGNLVYVGDVLAIQYDAANPFNLNSHMMSAKQLLINYNSGTDADLLFQLINSVGQIVYTQHIKTMKGLQTNLIELPELAAGWYTLQCIEANRVYNSAFVLSR